MIFISFIIPCYNTEFEILKKCISNILRIRIPVEILIIDDGSDSQQLIYHRSFFEEKGIRWIKVNHQGVSNARNVGIDSAKGKYIFFIDSDDEIPDCFINFVNKSVYKLNADWVLFNNLKRVNEKIIPNYIYICTNYTPDIFFLNKKHVAEIFLSRNTLLECWGKLISKNFLIENNLKFEKGMLTGEDALFNSNIILKSQTIQFCNVFSYIYRESDKSVSRLLKDPYIRYHFLEKRYLSDLSIVKEILLSKIQYYKILNSRYIHGIGNDLLKLLRNKALDVNLNKYIMYFVKKHRLFDFLSISDFKTVKGKIYYILVMIDYMINLGVK